MLLGAFRLLIYKEKQLNACVVSAVSLGSVAALINIWWVQKFKVTMENLPGILRLHGSCLTREQHPAELTAVGLAPSHHRVVYTFGGKMRPGSTKGFSVRPRFSVLLKKERVIFFVLSFCPWQAFSSPIQGNQTLSYRDTELRLLLLLLPRSH